MTRGSFDSIISYDARNTGNRVMVVYGARVPGFLTMNTAHPVLIVDTYEPEWSGGMIRFDIEAATIAAMIADDTYRPFGA